MREPLAGWKPVHGDGWSLLRVGRWPGQPLEIAAHMDGRYDLMPGRGPDETGGGLLTARIAAEDAARAMVAGMAKALGGSVAWATEGGAT